MPRLTFLLRAAILTMALGCSSSGSAHPGHVDTNDESGAGGATAGAGGGDSTGGAGGHAGTGGQSGNGGSGGSTGGAGGDLPIDAAPPNVDGEEPDDVAPPEDTTTRLDAARDLALDLMAADRPRPTDAPPGAYDPCPAKGKPCVVLPLGDSLTQGAYSSGGGYRRELFREVVAHNQSVTFVGSQSAGPAMLDGVAVPFPRHHEGHGGFTIEGISTWLTDNNTIATYKPDVVLLHIGTNNGLRHPGPNIPNVLSLLGKLIDQLVAADPRMLIVVAQIIPSKSDDGVKNTLAYNAGIPAVVAARASAGKHVVVVDLHTPFVADPNWKVDYLPTSDVHPIDAGYDVMGKAWYSVLGPLLR